jgi:predicted metalloprotease with PDZ domain
MHSRLIAAALTALLTILLACEKTRIVTKTEFVYQTNRIEVPVEVPRPATYRIWGMIGARIADTYEGTKITQVITNSTAEQAGLRNNDILLRIGEISSGKTEAYVNYILNQSPGTDLPILVRRAGKDLALQITVGAYPADEQLYLMAKAAFDGLDFTRADELLKLFESLPSGGYSDRAKNLRDRLVRQIGPKAP